LLVKRLNNQFLQKIFGSHGSTTFFPDSATITAVQNNRLLDRLVLILNRSAGEVDDFAAHNIDNAPEALAEVTAIFGRLSFHSVWVVCATPLRSNHCRRLEGLEDHCRIKAAI
jgi:hypothetical protein